MPETLMTMLGVGLAEDFGRASSAGELFTAVERDLFTFL